jgi:hypothetical protein
MVSKKDTETSWVKIVLIKYNALLDFSGSRFLQVGFGQICPGGQIMRTEQDVLVRCLSPSET